MRSVTPVSPTELSFVGRGLRRPECVLCGRDGTLYVSDWRGGVTLIAPGGGQRSILPRENARGVQPNGIALDRDGSFLLANLGDAGGIWRLQRDGTLEPFCLEVAGEALPPCNFVLVDGDGGVWITSIVSNRVIRISPDGEQSVLIEDVDPARLQEIESAFQAGELGRPHLDNGFGARLQNISSLAFGGSDLRTAYLGCLLDDRIATFRSPVPGQPLPHWAWS